MPGSDFRSALSSNVSTDKIGPFDEEAAANASKAAPESATDATLAAGTALLHSNHSSSSRRQSGELFPSVETSAATLRRQQSMAKGSSTCGCSVSDSDSSTDGRCHTQQQSLNVNPAAAAVGVDRPSQGSTDRSEDVVADVSALQRKRTRAANPPFWYSFDYGAVHFVAVSSEHDLRHGSDQARVLLTRFLYPSVATA